MGPCTALHSPVMLNHKWMPNHLLLPQGLSDEQTGSVTFLLIIFLMSLSCFLASAMVIQAGRRPQRLINAPVIWT